MQLCWWNFSSADWALAFFLFTVSKYSTALEHTFLSSSVYYYIKTWSPLKVPVFGKIGPRTVFIKSSAWWGELWRWGRVHQMRKFWGELKEVECLGRRNAGVPTPHIVLPCVYISRCCWVTLNIYQYSNFFEEPGCQIACLCSRSQHLGFLGYLSKLACLLGSVRAAVVRTGRRRARAAAAGPRPAPGLEMTCAWSGQGSRHQILAENDCLCGQLASWLAD